MNNKIKFKKDIEYFNIQLKRILSDYINNCPIKLKKAIYYSLFPGGKRIRPILLFASGEMVGISKEKLIVPSVAIELIHNYSLIHDDLPAMDNDTYRRGKLTVHKKFDEATAILAGDALLSLGFEIFVEKFSKEKNQSAITLFSKYVGLEGLIAGQVLDMESEKVKKFNSEKIKNLLKKIHINKTAKLIELCITIPGIIKKLSVNRIDLLKKIGRNYGLLFQITDDLLDAETLQDNKKLTYPNFYGREKTKKIIKKIYNETKNLIIKNFGLNKMQYMLFLLDLIVDRIE